MTGISSTASWIQTPSYNEVTIKRPEAVNLYELRRSIWSNLCRNNRMLKKANKALGGCRGSVSGVDRYPLSPTPYPLDEYVRRIRD
jgi:hypothetical protein